MNPYILLYQINITHHLCMFNIITNLFENPNLIKCELAEDREAVLGDFDRSPLTSRHRPE